MRFWVHRTTAYGEERQPCAGAIRHAMRFLNGAANSGWTIELPDLDALMAFAAEHGSVIVGARIEPENPADLPWVEIYDGYRE